MGIENTLKALQNNQDSRGLRILGDHDPHEPSKEAMWRACLHILTPHPPPPLIAPCKRTRSDDKKWWNTNSFWNPAGIPARFKWFSQLWQSKRKFIFSVSNESVPESYCCICPMCVLTDKPLVVINGRDLRTNKTETTCTKSVRWWGGNTWEVRSHLPNRTGKWGWGWGWGVALGPKETVSLVHILRSLSLSPLSKTKRLDVNFQNYLEQ